MVRFFSTIIVFLSLFNTLPRICFGFVLKRVYLEQLVVVLLLGRHGHYFINHQSSCFLKTEANDLLSILLSLSWYFSLQSSQAAPKISHKDRQIRCLSTFSQSSGSWQSGDPRHPALRVSEV